MVATPRTFARELRQKYGEDYVRALRSYVKDPSVSLRDLADRFGLSRQSVLTHLKRLYPSVDLNRRQRIRAKVRRVAKPKIPTLFKFYPELRDPRILAKVGFKEVVGPAEFKDFRGRVCLVRRASRQRMLGGYEYKRLRLDAERLKRKDAPKFDYVVVLDDTGIYKIPAEKLGTKKVAVLFEPDRWARYCKVKYDRRKEDQPHGKP